MSFCIGRDFSPAEIVPVGKETNQLGIYKIYFLGEEERRLDLKRKRYDNFIRYGVLVLRK